MRLLAVDTTTPRASLAVVSPEGTLAEARSMTAEGHSRWLLPAVEDALRGIGLRAGALDAFAVTTGPGSFTGLRVGLSTVQGLALAAARPCLGLSGLDVLASSAAGSAEMIVSLIDALRDEVFFRVYGREAEARGEPGVGALGVALEGLKGETAFVGDGALRYRNVIRSAIPGAVFPPVDLFLAPALGRAALGRIAAGEGGPPGALRPLYLRGVHIRRAVR